MCAVHPLRKNDLDALLLMRRYVGATMPGVSACEVIDRDTVSNLIAAPPIVGFRSDNANGSDKDKPNKGRKLS